MEIINEDELLRFAKIHSTARPSIAKWISVAKSATWKNFVEVRQTFRSADYIQNLCVFDVGENKFRIVGSIDYAAQRLYILEVMTHSEYDR